MDPLDKLIAQDELLGADTDAQGDSKTHADDGLKLLHRVRVHWSTWPADDPTLDLSHEERLELDWAETGTPPRTLGRFQIKREIGRGGFGIVLLAYDPKLQQDVALKIPRAETMLSPEAKARMAREARAATILAHPGIVPVYEVGEIGTVPYICGAYCPGETLADWLTAHRTSLTPRLAAQIVASLAEAVQHAHSRGVIHR
ncbi:MAG: protein kinase, partial [Planctomycetota bacterium]